MIGEGEPAPTFELPAVIEGRPGRIALEDLLGESVVVLAFYPAAFNPSCTDETTDLDEFEVFRLQPDADVLAISGDSVYSHRAFSEAYDLQIPLLSDVHGEVAGAYGVAADDDRYTTRRAVVVVDHEGTVIHTWLSEDIEDRPDIREVQTAFASVGDGVLAETEYRNGYDRYEAGRDTFAAGLQAFEDGDWMAARSRLEEARDTVSDSLERFERAIRFSEDEQMARPFERAREIADELRRTAGLLSDAAAAHAGGNARYGETLQEGAETRLERLDDLGAPSAPDDIPIDSGDTGLEENRDIEGVREHTASVDGGTGSTGMIGAEAGGDAADIGEDEDELDEDELEAVTEAIETQDVSESDVTGDISDTDRDALDLDLNGSVSDLDGDEEE